MNFLEGELKIEAGNTIFSSGQTHIELPQDKAEKCQTYLGKAIFGVRPEKLTIAKEEPKSMSFSGKVEFIEKLGDTQQVFLKVGEQSVTASAEAHFEIEAGDQVYLIPDMERIHIFAGENEKNITL